MVDCERYDVIVVGGGPSGATAAADLAQRGQSVLLLERDFRIKPCGGAIPPCLLQEFDIPESVLVAKINSARMVSPSEQHVDMPIGGFVGMVDREHFDPWLRSRAVRFGAELRTGVFKSISQLEDGRVRVRFQPKDDDAAFVDVEARAVIGADGANSAVAKCAMPGDKAPPYVVAYHEIIESPDSAEFDGSRCDVWYQGRLSPDFYAWVFPHGTKTSVGVGTAHKSFDMKNAVDLLRDQLDMKGLQTLRREGAPIPLKPRKKWDNGINVVLAGDAAGVVAPASGEGIYYAMLGGRLAADSVAEFLVTGSAKALTTARKRFMKDHGRIFWALGLLQKFWYSSDKRREKFVKMCRDEDVQRLTWESYMHKKMVKREPMAHVRVFIKDVAELLGLARA